MSEDQYTNLMFMAFGVVGWAFAPMAGRITQWWHDNLGMPVLVAPRIEISVIRIGASLAFLSGLLGLVS